MENGSKIGLALIIGIVIVIATVMWINLHLIQNPSIPSSSDEYQVLGKLSHDISLEKTMNGKVDKVMVYKSIPARYTRQDILSMAQKFNISPIGRIKELAEGSSVASVDGKVQAILHNSGFVEYHNSSQKRIVNSQDILNNFISDDQAVKIATKFLKDRDLLPEEAVFRKITYGEIHGTAKDGSETVFRKDVEIWYGRQLNGMNVEGTQLMLAIDADGIPFDYFTNWRSYEAYKEMPVKTPDQAFEDLKAKGVPVGMDKPDRISINDVYLAYQTKAGAETELYLEPVWVFKGNTIVNGNPANQVQEYIPALSEVPPEFGGLKPVTTISTTSFTINLTTIPTTTTMMSVNETATLSIPLSPTVNTTTIATEAINQTITPTLTLPTTIITANATSGFNATNGS